jgi:hypothetical protein
VSTTATEVASAHWFDLRSRGFYLLLAIWMWIMAVTGFGPGYYAALTQDSLITSKVVHFHALVYVGWLVLYSIQSNLPSRGYLVLHRRLGSAMIAYAVFMVPVGLWVTISRFTDRVVAGNLDEARLNMVPPFTDMIVFPILFGLAVHYRRVPETHKRFMVLATTMLLVAAAGRMSFVGSPPNMFIHDAVWLSPVWIAMIHDGYYQRRVHPVYAFGALALVVISFRMALVETPLWQTFTNWLAVVVI